MQHLLRKQIISIALLIISSLSVHAQKNEVFRSDYDDMPFHFGVNLGIGQNYLNFERNVVFSVPSNAIANNISSPNDFHVNLGLSGSVRLSDHFLLRGGWMLMLTNKSIQFDAQNTPNANPIKFQSIISSLPLVLKIQSDRYNAFGYKSMMRHYIFGGGNASFDHSTTIRNAPIPPSSGSSPIYLKNTNLGYEYGFGLSFFLRHVTVSPEIKFNYGITNLNNNDATLLINVNKINANFINFTIHLEN